MHMELQQFTALVLTFISFF